MLPGDVPVVCWVGGLVVRVCEVGSREAGGMGMPGLSVSRGRRGAGRVVGGVGWQGGCGWSGAEGGGGAWGRGREGVLGGLRERLNAICDTWELVR